jgi:hypothetical protein
MPYVQRNESGEIIALWKEPPEGEHDFIPASDPAVPAFLDTLVRPGDANGHFSLASDLQMVRVIEDVINLLIAKHVIVLTDLPEAVQNKLLQQRSRREHLLGSTAIIAEGEQKLF